MSRIPTPADQVIFPIEANARKTSFPPIPPPSIEGVLRSCSQTLPDPSIWCSPALLNEWSGDTLVASEAREFLDQYRVGTPSGSRFEDRRCDAVATLPRRLFPTIRSSMSPSKALFDGLRIGQTPLVTNILTDFPLNYLPNNDGQPPLVVDSDYSRKLPSSSGTVKTSLPTYAPQGPMSTLDDIPDFSSPPIYSSCEIIEEGSKTSTPAEHDPTQGESPFGEAKRVRVSRKPTGKKPWQSPSQEDFSRECRYRIRLSKSAHSSPNKSAAVLKRNSKLNLSKGILRSPRLRSKSLDRLDHAREGLAAEAFMKSSRPKHAAQTVGITAGRKIKGTLTEQLSLPPRSRNGTPYTILLPAIEPPLWSDNSIQSSPCRRKSARDTSDGISLHGRRGIDLLNHQGLHIDHDGYELSLDTDSSNDDIHQELKAESRLSPLEISGSSLIPRGTSSSPCALRNTQQHRNATNEPFWIRSEGKLYVCFPSNPEKIAYRIEVHAEIDLSAPDAEGWSSFSIPGLPRLHASQASGRLIFFHEHDHEVSIDKNNSDFFDDAEANLVLGGSHFDGSPLLRIRLPCQSYDMHNGALAEDCKTSVCQPVMDDSIKTDEAEVGTQQGDDLSKWTDEQIRLCPVYFEGLASRDDPLELEDPTKLIWNFHIRIDRIITGELECQMSLDVSISSGPLLVIDSRDWVPNYSLIDGQLATPGEWRETEDGDMTLQRVASTSRNITKVDVYWKEFDGIVDELTGREATPTRQFRVPNTVGKILLNGSLTCNIDNAVIVLNDIYGEEITWRADSMIGCNTIRLPKLYPGYSMYLKVSEATPSISEDLASLPDMDAGVERELATPRQRGSVGEDMDQRVVELEVPKLSVKGVLPVEDPRIRFYTTTTTVSPAEPSIVRRILKYCVLTFILLHILEQIPTVSTPFDNCSEVRTLQQKDTMPEYESISDDPTFRPALWSLTADDSENAHTAPFEEGHQASEPKESDQLVAEVPADKVQNAERETNWRDRIDHALGWRELGG